MADAKSPARPSSSAPFIGVVSALLRRLRGERELVIVIIAAVIITTIVFAAIPRLFNRMADDGMRYAIDNASSISRNLIARQVASIPAGSPDNVLGPVDDAGREFRSSLASSIQEVTSDPSFIIDTTRYTVENDPDHPFPFPRFVTLRYQQDVEQHLTLVEGAMPQVVDESVPVAGADPPQEAAVFEVAISTETARQIQVAVGDSLLLRPSADDPIVRRIPYNQIHPIAIRISGLFEVNDVDEEYWISDTRLNRALEFDDGMVVQIFATALFAPDAYPTLGGGSGVELPFQYYWRYFVDSSKFDAGNFSALTADMRKLDAQYGAVFTDPTKIAVTSGLSRILRDYSSQRNLTRAILSLMTVGLIGVGGAVLALVAGITADRRRDALLLIRGRGGSARQILGSQLIEGLLLSLPGAVVAWFITTMLISGRSSILSFAAAIGVAAAMTLLLIFAHAGFARRPLGDLEQGEVAIDRVGVRRLVIEILVVALALVGVYLVRRRGIAGSSSTNEISTMDPWLAAVPVLLGLAVGLLIVRLYPLPVRLFGWLSSLRRDLVPVLGFRRTSRQPGATSLPVLVLLLSLAVSSFAMVLTTTISRGQVAASWQQVGADYRVSSGETGYLYSMVDPSKADGVEAVANAVISNAIFSGRVPGSGVAQLMLVEPARLQDVTAGTPADAHMPEVMMREQTGNDIGQPTNPIPAIISPSAAGGRLSVDDTFGMTVLSREMTFVVVEVRERFSGLPADRPFVIAPLPSVALANPSRPIRATDMFVRGPREIESGLDATIRSQSNGANFSSRAAIYDAVHDAPLIAGVATGFRLGLIVTALYAGVAVAFAMLLRGKARARDQAYLRTLGLSREQSLGLTIVEQAPGIIVGIAAGVGLGVAAAWLVAPGLDLLAFIGPGLPVELQIDWPAIAVLVVVVLVVTTVAILLTTRFARKISLGEVLRLGDR